MTTNPEPQAPPPAADTKTATASTRPTPEQIEAVRAEGLTAQQLRLARRNATQLGYEATSDYEAVLLLRQNGVDPFRRPGALLRIANLQAADATPEAGETPRPQPDRPATSVPAPVAKKQTLPARPETPAEARARDILRMQRDIARRRRLRMLLLAGRLAAFILLPTLIVGWYYFRVATPLYGTQSEFVIQQADARASASTGGIGGMLSGGGLGAVQDAITVQSYLASRDAMLRLDADQGFREHFSRPGIDPILRLAPDATNEAMYRLYQRMIRIGFDPTEGLVRLEVRATDPATSEAFSRALIGYAEERVDQLTKRLRDDQMAGARESYATAELQVAAAQTHVLELQKRLGVLDPASEGGAVMRQIAGFETGLTQKRLELGQLLDNPTPNAARVAGVEGDIARLENLIASLRAQLTEDRNGAASLAEIGGRLRIAEADLATRQTLLGQAAQQLELARIEAGKQVRYLSLGVAPVPPDEPTYPRAALNTLLAFLAFSGIYLMVSLTGSILKEQVV